MMETFIHIREQVPGRRTMDGVLLKPGKAAISICYRLSETNESEQWALVSWSLCPPTVPYWNRKKGVAIARARVYDAPVQFQFESLGERLTERHILAAVRTFLIEASKTGPRWEEGDTHPIRPSRFTERWGTVVPGPDGSLLTAWIDVKPWHLPEHVIQFKQDGGDPPPKFITHWTRRPTAGWVLKLLEST
jgi:hypothetical protein